MATGKATIRNQSAERTKEAQKISSSVDRARHSKQQSAAKKAIAKREEEKRIEANIKKTFGDGVISSRQQRETSKMLAEGPTKPKQTGFAGKAEQAYEVGKEEVKGYEQPATLKRIEDTSKAFAKSARSTEVRIGGYGGIATKAVVEATARAGEMVGRLPTGAHIAVTRPKAIPAAATIAAYELTQLPKTAKADPIQFAADVLVMGTLFGAAGKTAGKVTKPLKALKPGEALKPLVPKKVASNIKAVDSAFKAAKLPLKKVKAKSVTKAKQTVRPITKPVSSVSRKVKVTKTKVKQEIKYKTKMVARPVTKPVAAVSRKVKVTKMKARQELNQKTRKVTRPITKPVNKTLKTIRSKKAQLKRKSKKVVGKELAATKKQLSKLAKDERAEVKLARRKQKTISSMEKVTPRTEISKQISLLKTKIKSLEKTYERTHDLADKAQIRSAQRQLKQLEAKSKRPSRPTVKEQKEMRRIERMRGSEDVTRTLNQRQMIELERSTTRQIRSIEAEALKSKKMLKAESAALSKPIKSVRVQKAINKQIKVQKQVQKQIKKVESKQLTKTEQVHIAKLKTKNAQVLATLLALVTIQKSVQKSAQIQKLLGAYAFRKTHA